MRKSILFTAFLFCLITLQAQNTNYDVAVGDILILGNPSGSSYAHVDFPRKNIIIKRGAIANFKTLVGKKLLILQIEQDKNGNKIATLKPKDGRNFFRFFPNVKADLSKSIKSGELKIKESKVQAAIANI